eukprot:TRINITY_DN4243_c0_g1_i5.p1 TRINITY_DN4243_c0_g1~~TRINITY_DN4243_c0_g1_i5.p1  ORF type:complete len:354 (-),score=50.48 TRINITY_DN4243_c0_g1_i5:332-1252(-)
MSTSTDLEISFLRAAKNALTAGFLSQADYEQVKTAFVKSQQMRAGSEVGFIGNEPYEESKRALVSVFANCLKGDAAGASNNGHRGSRAQTAPQNPGVYAIPAPKGETPGFTAKRLDKKPVFVPQQATAPKASVAVKPQGKSGEGQQDVKVNVPELGGAAAADKTSMSGIKVNKDAINLFNYVKTRRAHKWMMYRLNDAGLEVIISDIGEQDSKYDDFVMAFPENECRYGVYDWEYINSDGEVFSRLVFVHWAPNIASVKNKMMFASTKDFFKGFLDGISLEIQATDAEELQEPVVLEAVRNTIARK